MHNTQLSSKYKCQDIEIMVSTNVKIIISPWCWIAHFVFRSQSFSSFLSFIHSLTQAVDVGGSMFVHTFGAYFGLALSRVLHIGDIDESDKEGSAYHSDIFSMIGN